MFIRNAWYVAAYANELTDQNLVARTILGEPVLLWRPVTGQAAAFVDRCPHRGVPLSIGRRLENSVQCRYHGMEFAGDGRCVRIPGQDMTPDNASVSTWPVVERHGFVWIWMGAADLADADLIPETPWMVLEGWRPAAGYHHFNARFNFLTDNLLDLSHESYVHESTIGNVASESIADYPVKVTQTSDQVVRAHRAMSNIEAPPFFQLVLGGPGRINRWQTAIWAAPTVNITDTGVFYVNEGEKAARRGRVLHLLTPETEHSTHYFWSLNRNYQLDNEDLTARIVAASTHTIDEDKWVLELQERAVKEGSQCVPAFVTRLDNAPLRANKIHQALLRQELEDPRSVSPRIELGLN